MLSLQDKYVYIRIIITSIYVYIHIIITSIYVYIHIIITSIYVYIHIIIISIYVYIHIISSENRPANNSIIRRWPRTVSINDEYHIPILWLWAYLMKVIQAERTWWRLFRLSVPDEGYSGWAYLMKVIQAERTWWRLFRLSVPDEGYSRNLSCALNLISTFKGAHTGIVFEQYKSDVLLESRLLTGQRPPPNNQWKTLRLSVYVTLHLQKPWRWPVLTKTTDNFLFYHLVTAAKNKRGLH
jgi:hypothetical protein